MIKWLLNRLANLAMHLLGVLLGVLVVVWFFVSLAYMLNGGTGVR